VKFTLVDVEHFVVVQEFEGSSMVMMWNSSRD